LVLREISLARTVKSQIDGGGEGEGEKGRGEGREGGREKYSLITCIMRRHMTMASPETLDHGVAGDT
jgi:hypothetical protein